MLKKDVIVIGAGLAGMVAALEAQSQGSEVVLITKGPLGIGSNSALCGGRFAGSTPRYLLEEYVGDTLRTGKGLNCESMVRLTAQEVPQAFSFLSSLGLRLTEFAMGYAIDPVVPGDIPGAVLVRTLAGKIRARANIDVQNITCVTEILKNEEAVYGIRGVDHQGREVSVNAPAIVLAAGGAGAIFCQNDNQKGIMGQGYYLAAKARLELWDMEFVQFYPLVIAEPGLPSLPFFLPCHKETRLIRENGEDILSQFSTHDITQAAMTERDEFSVFLFRESLKGPIYMDCRQVPASFWENNPWRRTKFDFGKRPLAISPAAHFFMGGVRIDERGQTSLPGLFACGEVVWGLHGANRMGGNAVTECVVFGKIAGHHAARYALTHPLSASVPETIVRDQPFRSSSKQGDRKLLLKRIRQIAWEHAGIIRSQAGLKEGLAKADDVKREVKGIVPRTVFEKRLKEELLSASFVLKSILLASSARTETRGSFYRDDYPKQDDLHWRMNSCLTYDVETDHFTINHFPPS